MKILQTENFSQNFGTVRRSSALFYYRQGTNFKTTVSVFDYWKIKRALCVGVMATLRDMQGNVVDRFLVSFDKGPVRNLCPVEGRAFEGSLEVEAFATENLVIPYAAAMAIYETPKSISMVHSYSRVYSSEEVAAGRTVTQGEEGCWTLLDSERVQSFGIFHNGAGHQKPQNIIVRVQNALGATMEKGYALGRLSPYETVKIVPRRLFPDLVAFLDGKPGDGSVSFQVNGSFTRMLVGNESIRGDDFQITHSNFNYSVHETDCVGGQAFMRVPPLKSVQRELVVYPHCHPGNYVIGRDGEVSFSQGERVSLSLDPWAANFSFQRTDGALPSRIVTGLRLWNGARAEQLPAECSLGVIHKGFPKKHFYWGVCDSHSRLAAESVPFPGWGRVSSAKLIVSLYGANRKSFRRRHLNQSRLSEGAYMGELFPEAEDFLGGELGWYSLYSETPHLSVASTLEKPSAGLAYEHSF